MVFWVALDPRMDGARAGPWRAAVFFLLATSGLALIFHVAWDEGSAGPDSHSFGQSYRDLLVLCHWYGDEWIEP
ncbi:hypothetical protein IFM51744_01377 [Aspergillus udagawae]|nr:hypothetical protein IFM51744_01377 [Aspergillus udagawae]